MSWWQDCGQYINPWQWKYIDKQLSLHSVSSVSHECLLWVTKNRISCWIANLQFWIATYGQLFQLANATRWMKRLHGNLMSLISWRKHMTGVASSMCASSRNVIIPTPTARSKNSPRVHTHVRKYHTRTRQKIARSHPAVCGTGANYTETQWESMRLIKFHQADYRRNQVKSWIPFLIQTIIWWTFSSATSWCVSLV